MEEKMELPNSGVVSNQTQGGLRSKQEKRTARRLAYFCILGLIVLLAGSCDNTQKLYIYNWTYYTPDSVIEKFEKEFNVRVIYDEFASNEDMYAKLKSGGSGYDIVFPSADYTSIMIQQNMFEKINKSLIPNLVNIDPVVLKNAKYDPNMEYSVPYYFGAAGVCVNTEKVPKFERSWSIFAREDLRGRMTMLDDMRDVMGDALKFYGYSVNTINKDNGFLVVKERDVIFNYSKPRQHFIKKTVVSQNGHPREYPDKKVCPEWDYDKEQKYGLMFASCHAVTAGKRDKNCNNGCD
jgi:Spermidine/putrescine-binding periplasmic protein